MHTPNGFVDLQVNGYADVDFNADELNTEAVAGVAIACVAKGSPASWQP